MSVELSTESVYVAQNWHTIMEIIGAVQTLRGEMERELLSLREDLAARPWWANDWAFVVRDTAQVFVSKECWKSGDQCLVWIGVERFRPEGVFGDDDPPELYVWVAGKRYGLASELAETLGDGDGPGEIDQKPGSAYVVRQPVAKCLPDAVEGYLPQAREQIVTFLDHYARMADAWDPIVRRHLDAGGDG